MPTKEPAFQDLYVADYSHCYGCGRLNPEGLQIKTYWEGEESVTRFVPRPYHIAVPGFVYGGLLASLLDCHGTGTAAAAAARAQGRALDSEPPLRYVTASLKVDYLEPTPMGVTLEIRGRAKEVRGRKVVVEATLYANGVATVKGEIIAVQMPERFLAGG
ncbi:MAG: PaaI family thioesterase [Deltaproteobacteria bacterium]|nr:PaaI family thioesterase [Deltaproteobacteria bacterium]